MSGGLDKRDLITFGIRIASRHLNMDRDYVRLEAVFASKDMFESNTSHVKYCVVKGWLLFNQDWVEESDALDVLKYSFYVVHVIFCRDREKSKDSYEAVNRHIDALLSKEPIYLGFNDLGLENDNVIRMSKDYSERMIQLFSEEEAVLSSY